MLCIQHASCYFFPLRGGGSDLFIFGGGTQKKGKQQSAGTNLGGNFVTLGDPFAKDALSQ